MATTEEHQRQTILGESLETFLVDADVHEAMPNSDTLLPYLAPEWHNFVRPHFRSLPTGMPFEPPNQRAFRREWEREGASAYGNSAYSVDILRDDLLTGEGVSVAILNGFVHFSAQQGWYEQAAAMAAAYNDWQIEQWLEKEPRLRGSVHVVAHDPQQAAREIDRVGSHPQVVQVFLPGVNDRQYGDPMYHPIYEAAVRNDLALALHFSTSALTALGWMRYFVEWHALAPQQVTAPQIASLVFNGVFDRFPTLKVSVLEAGVMWVPWLMRRLDMYYKEFRVEVPWVKRLPSKHIRDNVRFTTQPMEAQTPGELTTLIEQLGSDRMLMFSTDYPHWDADSADAVLPRSLPEELRRRIRWQNAVETYPKLLG